MDDYVDLEMEWLSCMIGRWVALFAGNYVAKGVDKDGIEKDGSVGSKMGG
jgi:hypothetical protein